jgi:hypothetical protein
MNALSLGEARQQRRSLSRRGLDMRGQHLDGILWLKCQCQGDGLRIVRCRLLGDELDRLDVGAVLWVDRGGGQLLQSTQDLSVKRLDQRRLPLHGLRVREQADVSNGDIVPLDLAEQVGRRIEPRLRWTESLFDQPLRLPGVGDADSAHGCQQSRHQSESDRQSLRDTHSCNDLHATVSDVAVHV